MKVYPDDVRQPPKGWVLVKWPAQAIKLLQTGEVTHISLDHDLGDDSVGTGYDVILWIEQEVVLHGFIAPIIQVHSANTPARRKMEAGIMSIIKRGTNEPD